MPGNSQRPVQQSAAGGGFLKVFYNNGANCVLIVGRLLLTRFRSIGFWFFCEMPQWKNT